MSPTTCPQPPEATSFEVVAILSCKNVSYSLSYMLGLYYMFVLTTKMSENFVNVFYVSM